MRKELLLTSLVVAALSVFFMNEMIRIDYNLNLIEYISLSRAYTDSEKEILKKYGTLTYGGNIMEPPLGKYYDDTGQYLGLVTDMIYALAIELETDIVMRPLVWNEALNALETGSIDLCDLTPSSERARRYIFTDRIYDLNGVALVRKDQIERIKDISDLEGMRVGVQNGDYIIESLSAQNVFPIYVETDNLTRAMDLLKQGEVDSVVGDEPVIKNHLNDGRNLDKYEILSDKIYESYVVLGMPKTHSDLKPIINKAIFQLKRNGVLQKIQGKWLGTDTVAYEKRMNEKMKSTGAALAVLFGLVIYLIYAWNRNLKKLVDQRTLELKSITDELEIILSNIKSTIILIDHSGCIRQVKGDIPRDFYAWKSLYVEDKNAPPMIHAFAKACKLETKQNIERVTKPVTFDFTYLNKIYHCYLTPIEAGQPFKLAILTDETLERIQKSQIFQSDKMVAIGRLAAGIAHELRNPLGTVRNSAYILKETPSYDEEEHMAIESIERSVSRASAIIDSLLNYAHVSDLKRDDIKLCEVLNEVMNYYKKNPENRNIEFILNCDPSLRPHSNETAIRHVVTNLIGNGIEALSSKGKICIEVQAEQILGKETLVLKVIDNGQGIENEHLSRIFDPFYTTKAVGQGTGLGLYVVYSQLEKIGGRIDVQSQVGIGSTFTVFIPVEGCSNA